MDDLELPSIDRRLCVLIGTPLPADEVRMWAAMSNDQRAVAMRRMKAISRWVAGRPPHDAKVWAGRAGVGVTRFYEMSKAWRARRSLATVEAFAEAPRSRTGAYDSVIADELGPIIDRAPEGKEDNVRYLALELAEALEGKTGGRSPSYITLRRKVQEELRARARKARPGSHVQFDCCAISMATLDRDQLTMFAVVDVQTQIVLGEAIGDARDSRQGHALAARSALDRIRTGNLRDIEWTEKVGQMELGAGADFLPLLKVPEELIWMGIEARVQVATERYGRYLRKVIGDRIGHIHLLSAAATKASYDFEDDRPPVSADDVARWQLEIALHNAARSKDLKRVADSVPPAGLITTLEHFASWLRE